MSESGKSQPFCENLDYIPRDSWDSGGNGTLVPRKGVLVQGACREMSASHDVVSLREVNADVTESSSCDTPAQQSVQSRNSFACTSCFSAVVVEFPCIQMKQIHVLGTQVPFPPGSKNFRQYLTKGWDSPEIS